MYFSWFIKTIKSLQRTTQRRVLRLRRTHQLPLISLRPSMYGRDGRWRSWIFSLLGRPSKRLFPREVRPWPILSKKTFWRSLISFWFPSRTCSRLGWGFLVDAGWGTLPVPKETTQITSSSNTKITEIRQIRQHKSHTTHPAIAIDCWIPSITSNPSCIDWDDTAYHCCSVNLLGLKHIACLPTRPFGGTCLHDCKDLAEGAYLR